ncbi:MAG: hypothetical protein ABI026_02950, partial [Gemmatimonadaceae bacterium]
CAPKKDASSANTDSLATAVATVAPTPNVVTVHAKDYSYDGPAEFPAGMTTFKLINDGKMFHHLEIIKLDSGKTMQDLEQELAKPAMPPTWAVWEGGPNAPDPGKESNATLNLAPGNYVMICMVQGADNVPHFAKGMIKPFTVTAASAASPAPAPTADVYLNLSDYKFEFSKPVTAGTHTFSVTNTATQPHEVEIIRLAPGKSLKDVLAWLAKPAGPPPGSAIGGIAPFIGDTNYFTADITPGNYALICFVTDAKDGKPHFMHGMTEEFTVM